ncbi:hypothetical protein CHS0354_024778 [Potamilus streckersoni]|uniref:Uncharacterized protein n=1 Tax=Potamilus streckersoni TaxID=2493646 RepID=A0AAE0T1J3_9BIVA|nr:hypothetical protein CHS0354_024778 [Potamilus streckersoni]
MLREKVPLDIISPKTKPNTETSSILCYVFLEKYLPSPIFDRLLAACLAHWPIAKKNSENLIFCGCCVFDLDLHHSLTVFFREHVIFVKVTRIGTTENTLLSKWCINVNEFMTMTLSKVIGSLEHNLRFELSIQCPEFEGYAVNGLITVAVFERNVDVPCHFHHDSHVIISRDMLKFWFPEEETGKLTKPEGVISKEHVSSTYSQKAKLHQIVLNRRLPDLVKDLDFQTVSVYIQQKELFDHVTMRDILEQRTSTE